MSILVSIILVILSFLVGARFIIGILVTCFFGWLLCDIDIEQTYTWYSGIWHGIFFVPNYVRYLIGDSPYKAESYTAAYNVFYWIFSILSTLSAIFGGTIKRY